MKDKDNCTKEEAIEEFSTIKIDDNCWFGIIALTALSALFENNSNEQVMDLENKK